MRISIPEADKPMLSLFNPKSAVAGREIFGGVGFKQVASQVSFWLKRLGKGGKGKARK